jgi:hypothetical protein
LVHQRQVSRHLCEGQFVRAGAGCLCGLLEERYCIRETRFDPRQQPKCVVGSEELAVEARGELEIERCLAQTACVFVLAELPGGQSKPGQAPGLRRRVARVPCPRNDVCKGGLRAVELALPVQVFGQCQVALIWRRGCAVPLEAGTERQGRRRRDRRQSVCPQPRVVNECTPELACRASSTRPSTYQ